MVARMRLFAAVLAFVHLVHAHEDTIFTSSVSYCIPPETLFIDQFDVAYFPKNSSVNFNISASSIDSNVTYSATLLVNAYGMHLLNYTVNLCSLLNGALCPLPTYTFVGSDSIPLSSYVNIAGKIPKIAYNIPDLEGYVQLTLVDQSTGSVKACVQATLSNGWSMRQVGVEWTTGGFALFSLISALWQSIYPNSLAVYRLLDLLQLFQSIALSGLLNLNYPIVYQSFVLNFAWAIGLFPSHSIQSSIDTMRRHTGGTVDSSGGGSVVALTNRKYSPYNSASPVNSFATIYSKSQTVVFANKLSDFSTILSSYNNAGNVVNSSNNLATVIATPSNVLVAGIPVYASTLSISSGNAFMTVFFTVLIFIAISLGVIMITLVAVVISGRYGLLGHEKVLRIKQFLPTAIKSWGIRLALVVLTPITVFAFYQWTLKDSWLSILLSVIMFLSVSAAICYPAFLVMYRKDLDNTAFHIPLWGQFRSNRYWFFLPLLVATICRSMFVAFAKGDGMVQVVLLIITEFGVLASVLAFRPHSTRGGDILSSFLAVVRLICTGLLLAFLQDLQVAPIPRVVIGFVVAVIFCIAILFMFVNTFVHLIERFRSRQLPETPSAPGEDLPVYEEKA